MRITRLELLMSMAKLVAKRGTCLRLQVGAVLAFENRVISTGYVGAPSGFDHCTPDLCGPDKPCTRTVHAEANAIAFAARVGIAVSGCELFTTHSPCLDCAKLLINAGVIRIYFEERYRDPHPISLLKMAGIQVIQAIEFKIVDGNV